MFSALSLLVFFLHFHLTGFIQKIQSGRSTVFFTLGLTWIFMMLYEKKKKDLFAIRKLFVLKWQFKNCWIQWYRKWANVLGRAGLPPSFLLFWSLIQKLNSEYWFIYLFFFFFKFGQAKAKKKNPQIGLQHSVGIEAWCVVSDYPNLKNAVPDTFTQLH